MTVQGISQSLYQVSSMPTASASEESRESGAERAREAAKAPVSAPATLQSWQGTRIDTRA